MGLMPPIPIVIGAFGSAGITIGAPTAGAIIGSVVGAALGWGVYTSCKAIDNACNQTGIDDEKDKQVDNEDKKFKKPPVRTEPKSLEEQLALEEARANPGKEINPDKLKIKDPRYPIESWAKNEYKHTALDGKNTEIHYWENRATHERHGFKFKDYDTKKKN